MRNTHKLILGYVVLALILVLPGCGKSDSSFKCEDAIGCVEIKSGEPVKIGVLQDLSGSAAPIGNGIVKIIELAVDDWEGELVGHPIELLIEDGHCTPEGGANAVLRLIADPQVVGILGPTCSDAGITAAKIMSEAGLVMISGTNVIPSLTGIGDQKGVDWQPGYFRTVQNGLYWGHAVASFAYNELSLTQAATINDGDAFTQEVTGVFEDAFEQLGGEIVFSAVISRGDPDTRPVLRAIQDAGAEFIFAPLFPSDAYLLILQSQEIDPDHSITLMLSSASMVEELFETVHELRPSVYFVDNARPQGPAVDQVSDAYRAAYGTNPPHIVLSYGYDAATLLFTALQSVAVVDGGTLYIGRQALRDTLYATRDLDGITGKITCNDLGDCSEGTFEIFRLDDLEAGLEGLFSNAVYRYSSE